MKWRRKAWINANDLMIGGFGDQCCMYMKTFSLSVLVSGLIRDSKLQRKSDKKPAGNWESKVRINSNVKNLKIQRMRLFVMKHVSRNTRDDSVNKFRIKRRHENGLQMMLVVNTKCWGALERTDIIQSEFKLYCRCFAGWDFSIMVYRSV